MKIKKVLVIKLAVYILLFLLSAYSCFYLYSILGFTNNDYRLTCLVGFFLLLWLRRNKVFGISSMSCGYKMYLQLTVLSVAILACFTFIKYSSQSFQLTLRVVSQYLLVVWAVPIFYTMNKDDTEFQVLNVVCMISIIWCGLVLLQSIYYNNTGRVLFEFVNQMTSGMRDNRLRISVGPFANFSIIYCFWKVYFGKIRHNFLYMMSLAVLIATNIFVQQSRAATIIIAITIITMVLMETNKAYPVVKKVIIIIGIVFFAILSDFISTYILNVFTKYEISVTARTYAYDYFWNVFKSNPLFGFGFVKSPDAYNSILHGPLGIASTDDVGFAGQIAVLGIFAIVIVLGIYTVLFKHIMTIKKYTGQWDCLLIGIYVYLISSSFTLIIFDQQRVCLLPIVIALFEFRSRQSISGMPY